LDGNISRLNLISLISLDPAYGFVPNFVSLESYSQGASNGAGITAQGSVSMEIVGKYRNCVISIKLTILVPSKSGSLLPLCAPFLSMRSPSILSHWEWDLGQSEVETWVWIVGFQGNGLFVCWNDLVELGIVCGKWLEDVYCRGHAYYWF
jgi:hypothetical protein